MKWFHALIYLSGPLPRSDWPTRQDATAWWMDMSEMSYSGGQWMHLS